MGVRHGAAAGPRYEADPRQLGRGRLGARPGRSRAQPREPRRLSQAGEGVSAPEARLAQLGLKLPEVAAPLAAYVPAVRTGNHVYTSGQLPFASGTLLATGKVGAGVGPEDATACARQCALNALAAVAAELGDLSA